MMDINKTGLGRSVLLEALANEGVRQGSIPYQKTFKNAATQTDNNSIIYAVSGGFLDEFRRFKEIVENHETILASLSQIRFTNATFQVEDNRTSSSPTLQDEIVSPATDIAEVEEDKFIEEEVASRSEEMLVSLGSNKTMIPLNFYESIDWKTPSKATRSLLSCVFGEFTLATSTMTGRPSPAFPDKPKKEKLDPKKIEDIIFAVTRKCSVSSKDVRSVIKSKCADAGKILRNLLKRVSS